MAELRLHAFSWSCKSQTKCWQPPFAFPVTVLNAQVCDFSQACRVGLFFSVCSLTICKSSLLPPLRAQKASHEVGVCVGEACGVLGELWASWGDLQVRHLQWLMGSLPDGVCNTVSSIYVPLTPSLCSICCSPSSCCTAHLSIPDGATKKRESLAVGGTTGGAGHSFTSSFSPMGEIMGQNSLPWHWAMPSWGRGDSGKVKLFLLRSLICLISKLPKLVLFGRKMVESSYSAMMMTSLSWILSML